MKKIGLISDTHAYWDDRYASFFSACDEIWHAGDIGSLEIYNKLSEIKPVRAVYGNIDGHPLRAMLPEVLIFNIEGFNVLLTHIGGYPGKYSKNIIARLRSENINLFISGHSHVLKVMNDKVLNLLHINPGAAGIYGFHKVRTMIRFTLDAGKISDFEIMELDR